MSETLVSQIIELCFGECDELIGNVNVTVFEALAQTQQYVLTLTEAAKQIEDNLVGLNYGLAEQRIISRVLLGITAASLAFLIGLSLVIIHHLAKGK